MDMYVIIVTKGSRKNNIFLLAVGTNLLPTPLLLFSIPALPSYPYKLIFAERPYFHSQKEKKTVIF